MAALISLEKKSRNECHRKFIWRIVLKIFIETYGARTMGMAADESARELIYGEKFIDELVKRIKVKQL